MVLLLQLPHPPGLPAVFVPKRTDSLVLSCTLSSPWAGGAGPGAQPSPESAAPCSRTHIHKERVCLLQGSCPKFSRIKIQEGAGNIVKSNALLIHCSSRESSGGNEMQKSCLEVFLLLSPVTPYPRYPYTHTCTHAQRLV